MKKYIFIALLISSCNQTNQPINKPVWDFGEYMNGTHTLKLRSNGIDSIYGEYYIDTTTFFLNGKNFDSSIMSLGHPQVAGRTFIVGLVGSSNSTYPINKIHFWVVANDAKDSAAIWIIHMNPYQIQETLIR